MNTDIVIENIRMIEPDMDKNQTYVNMTGDPNSGWFVIDCPYWVFREMIDKVINVVPWTLG